MSQRIRNILAHICVRGWMCRCNIVVMGREEDRLNETMCRVVLVVVLVGIVGIVVTSNPDPLTLYCTVIKCAVSR